MKGLRRKLEFLIERIDRYNGNIRYYQGKKRIGSLKHYENTKNIFYLMAPAYGNVGDEAIVEASLAFLRDMFSEYTVIDVDYLDTLQSLKEIKRIIKPNDLIVLQGGGNIGTLYYDAEIMREFIIKKFPYTTIISMPQSMYFDTTARGRNRYIKCKKIYNGHQNLTLVARENYSYNEMLNAFDKCKVLLNPDIVFYYSSRISYTKSYERSGIMTCLRTDAEDILGEKRYELIHCLYDKFDNVIISDTCVPRGIPNVIRECEVISLINQFRKVKIVITDRLHGMVIAALTNTPCLVLPSLDKKILGTYEWIKDVEFISFMNDYSSITFIEKVSEMMGKDYNPYEWGEFREKYFKDFRQRLGV